MKENNNFLGIWEGIKVDGENDAKEEVIKNHMYERTSLWK